MSAKTYGGSSWSSVQAKVEHDQKVNGLLNVFGVYDYTNDKMYTHCYKQKKSSQTIYEIFWLSVASTPLMFSPRVEIKVPCIRATSRLTLVERTFKYHVKG